MTDSGWITEPIAAVDAPPATAPAPFVPTFPEYVDSSMLALMGCPRAFYWAHIQHLRLKLRNVHMNAGGAYARAQEVTRRALWLENKHIDDAMHDGFIALTKAYGDYTPPEGEIKTWERVTAAYVAYWRQEFPPEKDYMRPYYINGKPCVEFRFSIPIPHTEHPVTGQPILFTGRIDNVILYVVGQEEVMTLDDKTTKAFSKRWADSWKLRGQLAGYSWALNMFGHKCRGSIIRGCAIQKTQIQFRQALVYTPDWKIEAWLRSTIAKVQQACAAWKAGYFHQAFDDQCAAYSGCRYTQLCESRNPDPFIDVYYERRVWDPLAEVGDEEAAS